MKKRLLLTTALLALMAAALVVLVNIANAPALSTVTVEAYVSAAGGGCLRFPTLTGASLSGQTLTLPEDFAGGPVLVIVPFDQEQQVKADTWLPLARELSAERPGFAYYSVAIFPDLAPAMRAFIRTGMNLVIADSTLHDLTLTAFLADRDAFLAALDIPDTSRIQVFLLDADGVVLWRGAGEYDAAQGQAARQALDERAG